MPIYHFNISNHVRDEDEQGTELPDDNTARVEAVKFAGAYLRDNPGLVWDGGRFAVDVVKDDDGTIFTLTVETNEN